MSRVKEKNAQKLYRTESVAAILRALLGRIQVDYGISERRTIRIDVPGQAFCRIDSVEHSRGIWKATKPDYVRSLYIAYGSVCELETQILLSRDLGYIRERDEGLLEQKVGEVERMLKGLIKALEKP